MWGAYTRTHARVQAGAQARPCALASNHPSGTRGLTPTLWGPLWLSAQGPARAVLVLAGWSWGRGDSWMVAACVSPTWWPAATCRTSLSPASPSRVSYPCLPDPAASVLLIGSLL